MGIIGKLLIYAVSVFALAHILPGVNVSEPLDVVVVAIVLVVLNAVLKPILEVLTLPINILSMGLFSLVINTVIVLLAERVIEGFVIDGLAWAFVFSILLSVVVAVLEKLDGNPKT